MRGEHTERRSARQKRKGSSPHARGACLVPHAKRCRAGLIPACAGSMPTPTPAESTSAAHPRMRGEHLKNYVESKESAGSSPHARGARRRGGGGGFGGLIPACAGSALSCSADSLGRRAHPRMRGERQISEINTSLTAGSSPHARGALTWQTISIPNSGLIPACAGSAVPLTWGWSGSEAHPRMRGERESGYQPDRGSGGSSPHARGAHRRSGWRISTSGLIPACAGSASARTSPRRRARAHPRMRGERRPSLSACFEDHGSGLIPACAGSALPDLHVLSPPPQFSFTFTQLTRRNPPPDTSHLRRPA